MRELEHFRQVEKMKYSCYHEYNRAFPELYVPCCVVMKVVPGCNLPPYNEGPRMFKQYVQYSGTCEFVVQPRWMMLGFSQVQEPLC